MEKKQTERTSINMIIYQTDKLQLRDKLIALDLGYSRNKPTCGMMHSDIDQPVELTFGDAINAVRNRIEKYGPCILTIEAVLSTFHNDEGNPDIRGDFEKGRGWYYGPGAVTLAAAMRFLSILRKVVSTDATVKLAEAFLSFKIKRSSHSRDARIIYSQFWETKPEKIRDGTEPILKFISGVPSVRVFA